jgi:two-component system cell cycle response regulator
MGKNSGKVGGRGIPSLVPHGTADEPTEPKRRAPRRGNAADKSEEVVSRDLLSPPPTEDALPVSVPPCDRATLTMITGFQAGSMHRLEGNKVLIGRAVDCQIRLDDLGASRRHARIMREGGDIYVLYDLGSKNGTTVHGAPIQKHRLADGDRIGIGPSVFFRFAFTDETEEQLLKRLYESSVLDALTGALNRKHFTERLESELAYAKRHETPLSFLLFDIDHFKKVNDRLGHLAGDYVLRSISQLVKRALRTEDILARYGGEEFAIIARGIDIVHALNFAERLRSIIEKAGLSYRGADIAVTISIGVASLACCPSGDMDQLIGLADTRLYEAKEGGRNRSVGPAQSKRSAR